MVIFQISNILFLVDIFSDSVEKKSLIVQFISSPSLFFVLLYSEVTKIVYFIGNEHMLIAHDSNRLRFS